MKKDLKKILSDRINTTELVELIKKDRKYFDDAFIISLSQEEPIGWRAAWLISKIIVKNDERIKAEIPSIIEIIPQRKDGHQRELLKILNKMEIDEKYEGYLFDACLSIWEDITKSSSVRITAFRSAQTIAEKYPDLRNEFEYFTEDIFIENLSPGIKRSFRKLLDNK